MSEILPVLISTAIRALLIALLATPIALLLTRQLRAMNQCGLKYFNLSLILVPFLAPALVVGFSWSLYSYRLANLFRPYTDSGATMKLVDQLANEFVYGLLLIFHIVPVAAIIGYLLPRSGSAPSADHCTHLLRNRLSLLQRIKLNGMPRLPHQCIVFCTLWVLAFIDIDLAALMNVKTWSLWLFDQQVGGLALALSIQYALVAATPILGVILIAVLIYKRSTFLSMQSNVMVRSESKRSTVFAVVYLSIAILLTAIIPLYILLAQALNGGFAILLDHPSFFGELANSAMYAFIACALSFAASLFLYRLQQPALTFACLVPGLISGLILALTLKSLLISLNLHSVLSTPFPLIIALSLLLLPTAIIFNWIYINNRPSTSLHLGQLLQSSPHPSIQSSASHLVRAMLIPGRVLSLIILFWLGFMELSCSALLHPAGSMPVVARLHNLMHYGHSQVLSAMIIITLAIPLMVIAFLFLINYLILKINANRLNHSFDQKNQNLSISI